MTIVLGLLRERLAAVFSDRPAAEGSHIAELAEELSRFGYDSVDRVAVDLAAAKEAAIKYEQGNPPSSTVSRFGLVGIARMALSVADPAYADFRGFNQSGYNPYRHLVTAPLSQPRPRPSATRPPTSPSPAPAPAPDSFVEFLRAGIDRVYPGQWADFSGGFGTAIEVNGLGIHVLHHKDDVGFAASVLGGLEFSPDLVSTVAKVSCDSAIGALTLREGQPGYWYVNWGLKSHRRWLEPPAPGIIKFVLDTLAFIPEYIPMVVNELKPRFGGEAQGIEPGWWYALLGTY
jgi:hypothetical protein